MQSILAVTIGSVHTTAYLIERQAGHFRLTATARTPLYTPAGDITATVAEAIRQIEKQQARILLAPAGWPLVPQTSPQQGVDAFVVTISAGPPLRTVLVGLTEEVTLTRARRAVQTTYAAVAGVSALDAGPPSPVDTLVKILRQSEPDAVLMVGGIDGGAAEPVLRAAKTTAAALQAAGLSTRPHILYAGNKTLRPQVAEILGALAPLTAADNVRPAPNVENLTPVHLELEKLYLQQKILHLPGLKKLSGWTKYPIMPVSKSFEKTIHYIGQQNQLRVLGVDVGAGATIAAAYTDRPLTPAVCTDAGIGYSAAALLRQVPVSRFLRWIPYDLPPEVVYNRLQNKVLHPASIPDSLPELALEYALVREAVRLAVDRLRAGLPRHPATGRGEGRWNLVIAAGRGLSAAAHPGDAALLLLDAVEPWGVTSLMLDPHAATGILAAVAAVQPLAAVEAAARGVFLNLGTVIAPLGYGPGETSALKMVVQYDPPLPDGPETVTVDIPGGTIERIPLPAGHRAKLDITTGRRFSLGLSRLERGAIVEVEGGVLGIIVDTRGRPLRLPADPGRRFELLESWSQKVRMTYAVANPNYQPG
ncbi:MAG: hypothetical protein D6784_17140 [Chloroflexi bacterium]|nr:MAG: hypothetical protein D6784_17140 [Chloroflexota bacterium]